ncbi:DUF2202 domain-containing protein [Granulicoccus phenolivorans]|uniref:DUF2202 domain-containing protein n=1 Tax=Granulicoccus phenolivorans TaxID=266854 RepID=UPI0004247D3B|nr:DUF2202 domain-containing protein [Granulicoccus phenolivorans]
MTRTRIVTGLTIATLTVGGGWLAVAATGLATAAPPSTAPRVGASLAAASPLSDAEKADLLRMADEERMAKDLYTTLAQTYPDATTFSRIATSEQRHEERVMALLDRYGLTHPSSTAGTYDNAEVQKLYNSWLEQGRSSESAAYQVGVDLETADIADLRTAIDTSDNADLDQVYGHLLTASEQHQKAFAAGPGGTAALGPNGQGQMNRQGLRDGSCLNG